MKKVIKSRSNTEKKQRKTNPKSLANLIPFAKGDDPRRNTKGRPKNFDQLRKLFQEIAGEEIADGKSKETITRVYNIGRAMSSDKKLMRDFLEFTFGKVPQAVTLGNDPDNPLLPKLSDEERLKQMKELAVMISSLVNENA